MIDAEVSTANVLGPVARRLGAMARGVDAMETDSIRTSGENTVVDIWIDGKMRSVSVSGDAIAAFLRLAPDKAAALTDDGRREFVRMHLDLVVNKARERLSGMDSGASEIVIDAGPGRGQAGARDGDRRDGDRRKGDRRKANLGPPASGERRR